MSGFRSLLYKLARILGDINAVKKGKVGKRVARRAAGRITAEDWERYLSKSRLYSDRFHIAGI